MMSPVLTITVQLIDAMEKKNVVKDIEIIREGMDGTHMYILEKGQVQVSKGHGVEKEFVCDLGEGKFKHFTSGILSVFFWCTSGRLPVTINFRVIIWRIGHSV